MNIPENIKIGGLIYQVETTDKLNLGSANCSAEIDYANLVIRICPQVQQKKQADFMHEVVHGIYNHLGYNEHDEKKIDELAQALYMVIQDNPKMFKSNNTETTL